MRLFIAVELSDELRDGLTELQTYLKKRGVRGKFSPEENLHLTLAFIGEYGDPDRVLDAMASVPFEDFSLRMEGFGSFGDLYWAGIAENEALTSYVKRLRRALAEADIPFDRKKFSPHITLIRRASFDRRSGMPGVEVPNTKMTVGRVSLFRSDRGKSGMIYTELGYVSSTEGKCGDLE